MIVFPTSVGVPTFPFCQGYAMIITKTDYRRIRCFAMFFMSTSSDNQGDTSPWKGMAARWAKRFRQNRRFRVSPAADGSQGVAKPQRPGIRHRPKDCRPKASAARFLSPSRSNQRFRRSKTVGNDNRRGTVAACCRPAGRRPSCCTSPSTDATVWVNGRKSARTKRLRSVTFDITDALA